MHVTLGHIDAVHQAHGDWSLKPVMHGHQVACPFNLEDYIQELLCHSDVAAIETHPLSFKCRKSEDNPISFLNNCGLVYPVSLACVTFPFSFRGFYHYSNFTSPPSFVSRAVH